MKLNFSPVIICVLILNLFMNNQLKAQSWDFIKDVDGIKIYTKVNGNNSLKSYKGEVDIDAPMEKVCALLGTATNFDWWGEDFTKIKILDYKNHDFIQYYFIYNMPWPATDRDLVVESVIKIDIAAGKYTVTSNPLLKKIPVNPQLVRISNYWQIWTVQSLSSGNVHVTIEGLIDPGGNVPSWLYNLLITELPLKTIRLLCERAISPKPANK